MLLIIVYSVSYSRDIPNSKVHFFFDPTKVIWMVVEIIMEIYYFRKKITETIFYVYLHP